MIIRSLSNRKGLKIRPEGGGGVSMVISRENKGRFFKKGSIERLIHLLGTFREK